MLNTSFIPLCVSNPAIFFGLPKNLLTILTVLEQILVVQKMNIQHRFKGRKWMKVLLGRNASTAVLNSPATPLPRSSVTRALIISPNSPMSPSRRFLFSTMNDASPPLRDCKTNSSVEKFKTGQGKKNWLLLGARPKVNDSTRSSSTSDLLTESTGNYIPRRVLTPKSKLVRRFTKRKRIQTGHIQANQGWMVLSRTTK